MKARRIRDKGQLLDALKEEGFVLVQGKGTHLKIMKGGNMYGVVHKDLGERRSVMNILRDLRRRYGVDLERG